MSNEELIELLRAAAKAGVDLAGEVYVEAADALAAADAEIERLRGALTGMTHHANWRHPRDTHVETFMPVDLFKEFREP